MNGRPKLVDGHDALNVRIWGLLPGQNLKSDADLVRLGPTLVSIN